MPIKESRTSKYYLKLAGQYNLSFLSLESLDIDASLLDVEKRAYYLKLQAIPITQTKTTVTVATANPTSENQKKINDFFSRKTGKKVNIVVSSIQDITNRIAHQFEKEYTHTITHARDDIDLFHSASHTFSLTEKILLTVVLILLTMGAFGNFFVTALWVNVFLATGTLVIMAYKMGLTLHTLRFLKGVPDEKIEVDLECPVYTILIPVLREKQETISLLLDALHRFDYPSENLDIKFLVEKDDVQTFDIIKAFDLPWNYQVLIVPPGLPRSKPRACNYGLQFALGSYLTIFDAEDRPDADQLKKVLQRFSNAPKKVVCIQAALNFYNYRENIITRLFTIEYTYWFDCLIPALDSLGVPVPLGGTSNHFKTHVLRKVRGWDPFIGTEDAEMGVRLYRYGYRVGVIRSTTYEEANTRLLNWFFQRTRWNKGYMQTYLVNMRDPINMIKQVGLWRFLNFQLFVGGNVFIQLANLPLWIFLITTFFFYNEQIASLYPKLLYSITFFNFVISNFILLSSQFVATYNRRLYCLLPFVPLKMVYWMIMSLAGYYAIIDLLVRPGYWYKTEHGFSKQGKNTDVPL